MKTVLFLTEKIVEKFGPCDTAWLKVDSSSMFLSDFLLLAILGFIQVEASCIASFTLMTCTVSKFLSSSIPKLTGSGSYTFS